MSQSIPGYPADPLFESQLLRDTDPRLCRDGRQHQWTYNYAHCHVCMTTPSRVAERFRDWRYEQVIERLTEALGELSRVLKVIAPD